MERSIGVIDSGVGGLTVVNEIIRQLPNEHIVYLGDTKRCPYGSRKELEIKEFTYSMVNEILTYNIKILVIACNTATAYTLNDLSERLDIPVIGVIKPGSRAAISVTKTKEIGVIGTKATIKSKAYEKSLKEINNEINVEGLACPSFVPMIESGEYLRDSHLEEIKEVLVPLKQNKYLDTLVLGCTHYPLIAKEIRQAFGGEIHVISSSEETAREASVILDQHNLLSPNLTKKHLFLMTGNKENFKLIYENIFDNTLRDISDVEIKQIEIKVIEEINK
ncbi:MAG TPA: glutamate racemase [Pseudogracilibacillus sp.]|nr:glutamate racemase [Pseudogracilibacillus sp.]